MFSYYATTSLTTVVQHETDNVEKNLGNDHNEYSNNKSDENGCDDAGKDQKVDNDTDIHSENSDIDGENPYFECDDDEEPVDESDENDDEEGDEHDNDELIEIIRSAAAAQGIPFEWLLRHAMETSTDDDDEENIPLEYPFGAKLPTSLEEIAQFILSEKCGSILVLAGAGMSVSAGK
jgi:hypothetical protein